MEESAERETHKDRWRGDKEGAHLLFDVNLGQALQLGGVFWYVCEQQRHTADKGLLGQTHSMEALHAFLSKP